MINKNSFIKFQIKSSFTLIIFFIFLINKNIIYIENNNKISEYEENIDFSNFETTIKSIALYLPQFHEIEENNKFWGKGFTEWVNVKKTHPRFKGHHQPRIPGDKYGYLDYYDLANIKVIENQMKLAKNHGIYGFGIYYYWFSGKKVLEKPINNFIKYSNIIFHFLLIWANENWTKRWDGKEKEILIKQEYKSSDPNEFIKDIKKYIKDKRYITLDKKPIIGLYEPNKIPDLVKTIKGWRKKAKEIGIGNIFILICLNNNKIEDFQNFNLFDASYEFPPRNSFQNYRILQNNTFIYFYQELLYKSQGFNSLNINKDKLLFFRGTMLEWDNCPRMDNCVMFYNYSPEQFYMFNKIIIDWTNKKYNKDYRFIFINAWNEWGEGSYLEPDNNFGYASINSLSKAIFNLSYIKIDNLSEISRIAIIAHIYKKDSIKEIINKIYNISYIIDLYIYTKIKLDRDIIKQYIQINSNINIFIYDLINTRENLLAYLSHFKKYSKNYKYVCNINFEQYKNISFYEEWKNYLHNNLLGNSRIIAEIITDFENNRELGLIFPEKYYKSLIQFQQYNNIMNLNYMNFILRKIYLINFQITISQNCFDYPEGNMFWAKVGAIYPIFDLYSNVVFTKKFRLILDNNLEKIWIYIAKYNGFFYKKIYKHL